MTTDATLLCLFKHVKICSKLVSNWNPNSGTEGEIMGKGMDSKKSDKKAPAKSMKEKKADKKVKKADKK